MPDIGGDDIDMNDDVLIACADLVGRTGATGLEIGFTEDDPPRWYAYAMYRGARVMVEDHPTPTTAALALSERLLRGALCRCRQPVTLSDRRAFAGTLEGCRWRLMGNRWEPSCDAQPFSRDEAARLRALTPTEQSAPGTSVSREERRRRKGGDRS